MYLVRYYDECSGSVQRMSLVCVFNRLRIIAGSRGHLVWNTEDATSSASPTGGFGARCLNEPFAD
jgi:hypothetical protein